MSRYMMFITHKEVDPATVQVPASLHEAMGKFVQAEFKSGRLVDTAGLQPTKAGWKVRSKDGKLTVKDGPFTETKEVVGGYAVVEAKSRDEAMDLARQFMELHRVHWPEFDCTCEVRPLEAIEGPPGQ